MLSDLHLGHGGTVPAHQPGADVIVLAGDLDPYTPGLVERLRDHWGDAPYIIYVLGNHEFYGTEIDETRARLAEECAGAGIHLLDRGTVRIDGIRFIGATLWTDLTLEGKADEVGAHMRVSRPVSDFCGAIRHRGRPFATGEDPSPPGRASAATGRTEATSSGRAAPASVPSSLPTTLRAHGRSDRGSNAIR